MPTRDTAPIGAPCWVDLSTSDTEKARAFYTELFGWTAQDPNPEFGGYFNFEHRGTLVAGCMASQPGQGIPDLWSVYLATDDIEKTLGAATDNGGEVHVAAQPVGDLGVMAFITDASGGFVGLWQPGTHKGFGRYAEPGTPAWFELHTRDHDGAIAFYRNVLRWDTQSMGDTDDFRYTVMKVGEEQLAGVMDASSFLPDGVPAHWSVYFDVEDTDKTLARTEELGGATVMPAEDTPYGRLAVATDATGAQFKLIGPNKG